MSPRTARVKVPRHRARLRETTDLLHWLVVACAPDVAAAVSHGYDYEPAELLARPGAWLPLDREASRDRVVVEGLVRTGHVEYGHAISMYKPQTGRLIVREALRLTREGLAAVVEYDGHARAERYAEALEVLLRMTGLPAADAETLRAEVREHVATKTKG